MNRISGFLATSLVALFSLSLTACGGGEAQEADEMVVAPASTAASTKEEIHLPGSTPGEQCVINMSCPKGGKVTTTGVILPGSYCSAPLPSYDNCPNK